MEKQKEHSPAMRYLIALLAPAVVAGIMQLTWPFFEHTPVTLFLLAVMFCGWYGGLGPGLLSVLISFLLADYFFMSPYFALRLPRQDDLVYLVTLTTVGSFISMLSALMHRARRQTEQSLESTRQSENQFRTMANSIPQLAWMAHGDGFIFWYNRRWHEYTGTTPEQMEGWGWQSVHHPQMLPKVLEGWQSAIATGEPFKMEFPLRGADGQFRTFLTRVQPLKNAQGRVVQWFGTNTDVEEIKRAEESIRTSEERLQTVIENLTEGLVISDMDGNLLHWNHTSLEMHGFTNLAEGRRLLPELVNIFELSALDGTVLSLEQWPLPRIYRGEHLRDCELHIRRPGTDWARVFSYGGSIVHDVSGRPLAFVTINDITERRRAEEEIAKLASIVESSDDAIISKTLEGIITSWNKGAERLYGYSPAEAIGQPISILIPPDHPAELPEIMEKIGLGKGVEHYESVRVRKDGQLLDISLTVSPLRNSSGVIVGASAIARDITGHKRTEAARHESEGRYRTLFESAPDGIVIADPEGYYVDVNASICRMLGYSRDELIRLNASDVVSPTEVQQIEPALRLIKAKADYHRERRFRRKDGSIFAAEVIATMMPDGNLMGMIRDITERKHAEEEVRRLNEELEQRVEQRTAQLAAANKELESFSYSVSHDLRAPLRHIGGFADMLNERAASQLDERSRHYLQTIIESSRHAGQLIDDLLSFSRMGRAEMRRTLLDINALVREIQRDLKLDMEGRSIVWKIADLPRVQGDPSMIRQVLTNLLANSVKYTRPRPQALIEIGSEENGTEIIYHVRDNGVGFDMQYAGKLFGVFQRLHRAEEFEGTGIGLANVQRIITRHGGSVWAEGAVNAGAAFYFTLPKSPKGGNNNGIETGTVG